MSSVKLPIRLRIEVTLKAVWHVLHRPSFFVIFITAAFLMSGAVLWSLNLSLLRYILFEAPISAYDKLSFFTSTYQSLFASFEDAQVLSLLVFSLLFGINTALFIYVIRNMGLKAAPKKSGGLAAILAILAGGCVACGTSLLTPILVTLGVTSSAFVRDLGPTLLWVGSLLTIYSIHKLSLMVQVATHKVNEPERAE